MALKVKFLFVFLLFCSVLLVESVSVGRTGRVNYLESLAIEECLSSIKITPEVQQFLAFSRGNRCRHENSEFCRFASSIVFSNASSNASSVASSDASSDPSTVAFSNASSDTSQDESLDRAKRSSPWPIPLKYRLER